MAEELPSIKDFLEDKSNLPSVETFTEEALPSYKDFIEPKEEEVITEEVTSQVVEERQDNTQAIVALIESVRNSIPHVKSYDKELYELVRLIEEVRREIPQVPEMPEVRYYDEQIQELKESIPTVPEVKYYDDDIKELKESIDEVKDRYIPDFRWIIKTFSHIDEDVESVNTGLAEIKGRLDLEINNLVESVEVGKFEASVDSKALSDKLDTVVGDVGHSLETTDQLIREDVKKIKDKIYDSLRETSLRIWNLNKEYKKEDKELQKQIVEQYKKFETSISEAVDSSDKKHDKINEYFNSLKEEIKSLPEVKYYDEEIQRVTASVNQVQNLVEVLEHKLNKKIAGLKESILVVPPTTDNSDPLTPLDQNFATLDDLSNHYRLFLNRVQQQIATLGGGGEVNLRYLDDIVGVATNLSAYNGKYLQVDTSNSAQPFKFTTVVQGGGGGGGSYTGTSGQLLQHNGTDYVGVSSVGIATYINDHHQGYYRYSTHYYSAGIANTIQTLPPDEFVMIQPSVRTNKVDFLPEKMLSANSNDPWVGSGATIGTGQTQFSLAGLDAGSSVIVRIAASFNPDIDNTNVDFSLNFTTNPTTQSFGTTHFSITREQGLICNEGADQPYISETLINFYVGSSLSGLTKDTAGSFNISARASDEGDFEMMALTINVVA